MVPISYLHIFQLVSYFQFRVHIEFQSDFQDQNE